MLKLVQVALTGKGLKDEMSMAGNGKGGEELVNTGSEGNLAVAAVTPLTAKINSFDNQVRLQRVPTKTHHSRERRIRMNCIHWNRVKKEKHSKRD